MGFESLNDSGRYINLGDENYNDLNIILPVSKNKNNLDHFHCFFFFSKIPPFQISIYMLHKLKKMFRKLLLHTTIRSSSFYPFFDRELRLKVLKVFHNERASITTTNLFLCFDDLRGKFAVFLHTTLLVRQKLIQSEIKK